MAQPETGGVRKIEDEDTTLETPSDDEEITIPSQEREDLRRVDIRGEQLENTQQEDWLLPTEPRHGARSRQTGAEGFNFQRGDTVTICHPTSEWEPPSVARKAD